MPAFVDSLRSYGTEDFQKALKHEIETMDRRELPLERATMQGGIIGEQGITATVISVNDNSHSIEAEVGVFFTEVIGGCSCGDDPLEQNVGCTLRFVIDKNTANTIIEVIS